MAEGQPANEFAPGGCATKSGQAGLGCEVAVRIPAIHKPRA